MKEEIMELMVEELKDLLGMSEEKLMEGTVFKEIGMQSVHFTQLLATIENEYEVEVPFMEIVRKRTIGEAAEYVAGVIEG